MRRWLVNPIKLVVTLGAVVPFTVLFRWMWFNGRNVPRFDQWRGFPVVYATQDGTLTLADLLRPFGEQMTFFSHLQTAIFTVLTDWNLWAEMWVNLAIGVLAFVLYVVLFARTERRAIVVVLIPFSLLVFMLRQDANWTNGYMSQWWFAQVWWLLALWMLVINPRRWWAAVIAGVFGFFATISQAVGAVTWAAVLVYLVLRRDLDWRQIAVWLVSATISMGYYLSVTPASVDNAGRGGFDVLVLAVGYMLAQVGVVFEAFANIGFVATVGGIALGLLLLNGIYLLWRDRDRESVALWGSVASYGLAAAYLIGVGRIPEDGFERIFFTWYATAVLPFWMAFVAVAAIVCWRVVTDHHSHWTAKTLLYSNIVAGGLLLMLYVPSNDVALNKNLSTQWRGVQERCIMQYIFVQGEIPFCFLQEPPELYQYNQLAVRRLALYAGREPESILHSGATDSDPVLIETHTPWLNTHIRDYFLDGVARERLYHIYPSMPDVIAEIPNPPQTAFTDFSDEGIDDLLQTFGTLEAFWYVRRYDYETAVPSFWQALDERGYAVVDTRERNDGMLVSRVVAVPDARADSPLFAEVIQLRAVSEITSPVAACETLGFTLFWEAVGEIPLDYSGSIRLLNENGEKVAQSDAGLGLIGTSQWQPGELYADQRPMTLPCELPPGTYNFNLGVYYYQAPGEWLTVSGGTLSPSEPNTVTLQTIVVEGAAQ
jgi:hypothetical protein